MKTFDVVEPLVGEIWVVDGKAVTSPPGDTDALHIRPILHQRGAVPVGTRVLHSLVLDNNVLTDIIESRRPGNTDFLENLLRSTPLELNPVMAMLEQRRGFDGASQALHKFAELLGQRFGSWEASRNAKTFDRLLEDGKFVIAQNVELLSGYLPAILYIYHQSGSAESKLKWLSELIQAVDLPFLQLPFYLAALLFLTKEQPTLFRSKSVSKVQKDTKLMSRLDEQKKKVLNLGHDVMLPAVAIFPGGDGDTFVFPYIATRDYLLQDFLGEVRCSTVVVMPDGRANGVWELRPEGRLHTHLGEVLARYLLRRTSEDSGVEQSIRRSNLQAFSDSYLEKCVELKQAKLT
ncbi:MAG: hypothetical protein J0I77_13955 [Rudaea sp.]|uniref:hypothetical protein n=1 Tax=unclassified Rudaea TaxID=2627037 RepID=UPI001ACD0114|nr:MULTISPECIES: hypothetical protein [unclassified Rudaea]MBN8886819.1 hypothetical protein [Rudaea sp.]